MSDVIEGRNAVLEALRAGMPVRTVLLAEGLAPDRAVVTHGRWRAKKVRDRSRLAPCAGRLNAHQNIASETSCVAWASNSPRW